MAVDIFFIIVLILMIDYDFVVVSAVSSIKYNCSCEIAFIENTEGNNIFEIM